MPRTIAETGRIQKQFGGISTFDHARTVPPNRAIRAENVTIENGEIRKRIGFKAWDDDWDPYGFGQIEGLFGLLAQQESTGTMRSYGVVKHLAHPLYDDSLVQFWLWQSQTAGWELPSNTAIINDFSIGTLMTTRTALITKTGQSGMKVELSGDAADVSPIYDAIALITDGARYAYKTPVTDAVLYRCGMPAPTTFTQSVTVAGLGDKHPSGTYQFCVTVCNLALQEHGKYADSTGIVRPAWWTVNSANGEDPGLESNPVPVPLVTTTDLVVDVATDYVKLVFTAVDRELHPWTSIRVYRRRTDSGAEESTFRHVATFAHPELGSRWGIFTPNPVTKIGDVYTVTINGDAINTTPATTGTWAFPPLRNYVPERMDYFARSGSRGYWGRSGEFTAYYSDASGPLSGGHIEAISRETIGTFDGPLSGIFAFFQQVIFGTPTGLNVLTGNFPSQSNVGVWTNAKLNPGGFRFEPQAVDDGPVLNGTGSHVIADNTLYYISQNGMVAYNGRVAINVSTDIQADLTSFSATVDIMSKAQLAHDPVRHIIYMLVRKPQLYPDEDVSSVDSQYVKSRIFCYHYRNKNPETGLGEWTQFDQIGPGALNTAGSPVNTTRRDRYSAIAMRHFTDRPPHLAIGHRAPSQEGTPGTYMSYRDAVVMEQIDGEFKDTHNGPDNGAEGTDGVSGRWEGGRSDWGLPDRLKDFWKITVKVASTSSAGDNLSVGFQVDGSADQLSAFNPNTFPTYEIPVGWAGTELALVFAWTDSSDDINILAATINQEALGAS